MPSATRVDADALSRFERFAHVPRPKLTRLAAAMSVWSFQRRERIFMRKEAAKHLYILLRGAAKLSGLNKAEQPVLVSLIAPGEMFGVAALLPAAIHQFQCDAFTDCVAARINPQQFLDIMLGVSLVDFRTVMGITVSQWDDLLVRYSSMLRLPVQDRIVAALAELSLKFGARDERGMLLTVPLTHRDLADLVGASRSLVTLHLSDLERDGAIIRERRRLIVVPRKLSNQGAIDPPAEIFVPLAIATTKNSTIAIA